MNASKENAKRAQEIFKAIQAHKVSTYHEGALFLTQFLEAAERKLPTEAAFKRDRQRRKEKAKC